jgi:hypothetical protein
MKNWEIIWIAAGIALSTASQLRLKALPLGPGESLLFAWMIFALIRQRFVITPITRVICLFWIIAFSSLALGLIAGELMEIASIGDTVIHDSFAFVFAASFSIIFFSTVTSKRDLDKLLLFVISFTAVPLTILLINPSLLPPINPWYGTIRFSGWSKDPNQLCILLGVMPFLSVYLMNLSSSNYQKMWCIFLTFASIFFGIQTLSDSLRLWWSISTAVLLIWGLYQIILSKITIHLSGYRAFIIRNIILIFLILITLGVGYMSSQMAASIPIKLRSGSINEQLSSGSQGQVRLTLATNGLGALWRSPLVGVGPGGHSGFTGSFQNFEAHNTFIDWGGSTGILGLTCYVTLVGWVGWKAFRSGSTALFAAWISLIGYAIFVYVLRHIVFWFFLLTIASLSMQSLNQKSIYNRK